MPRETVCCSDGDSWAQFILDFDVIKVSRFQGKVVVFEEGMGSDGCANGPDSFGMMQTWQF